MQKQTGPVLLIAGTAIGSGMIALPMVFAQLGLGLTCLSMFLAWLLVYYTALIHIELNLQAGRGLPLDQLGRFFSGYVAQSIGLLSLMGLSYALLAVYLDGSSSIIQQALSSPSSHGITLVISLILILILSLPVYGVDYTNRLLFLGLICVVSVLLLGLSQAIHWNIIPWTYPQYAEHSRSALHVMPILPILLTSFGFQVIFHTLTEYCKKNPRLLKKAFFWGSLIPALVYMVWTFSALSVLYVRDPSFYQTLVHDPVTVGQFVHHLSQISRWPHLQWVIWTVSILAILTSMIGVGLGLVQTIKPRLGRFSGWAVVFTCVPPYLIAIFTPYAFIAILRYAGLMLTVIAILMPIYLLYQLKNPVFHYPILAKHRYRILALLAGLAIIASELCQQLV